MNDADSNTACARLVKQGGGEFVIAALVFTLSPVHDDAHYAAAARTLAACPDIDAIYIKDPGGLLSPRRAQTLIPAVKAVIGAKPLELHAHCTIGLAEHTYMDAPGYGVSVLQCASGAAADGTSNPPSERVVANLRALGHSVRIDDEALREVSSYFTRLALAEGLPVGQPQGFDAAYLQHQLPGGMVGTMRRQLGESRLSHLEGAVIEEIGRVREELGWPIVMTPFAQIVMTQAVMNVTSKERYKVIPDEAIRYAIGRFGRPNVPIAGQVMDRIDSMPRTRSCAPNRAWPPSRSCAGAWGRSSPMRSSCCARRCPPARWMRCWRPGPAPRHYNPELKPVMNLIRQLAARRELSAGVDRQAGIQDGTAPQCAMRCCPASRASCSTWTGRCCSSDRSLGGYEVLPGAVEVLSQLAAKSIPYLVLTNGSAYPPPEQARRLRDLGLPVADDRMFTPSSVAADVMSRRGVRRTLVLGNRGVGFALEQVGIETVFSGEPRASEVDAVYVGWHPECHMRDIEAACHAIWAGAKLYVASDVPFFATRQGRTMGYSYAIVGAIRRMTKVPMILTGKPSLLAMRFVRVKLGVPVRNVGGWWAMIPPSRSSWRDRGGATAFGVTTGVMRIEDWDRESGNRRPHVVLNDLREVLGNAALCV